MSNLAPFVAATLRDKIVLEMEEEIRELRAKNKRLQDVYEPWTVRIHSPVTVPGQVPVVYATGKLNLQDLLIGLRDTNQPDRQFNETIMSITMESVDVVNPCRISTFLQSIVTLQTENEGEVSTLIGHAEANIGNGIIARQGRFEIGWWFYRSSSPPIQGIYVDVPIPTDRLGLVTPELAAGIGSLERGGALELALHVTDDGPVRFGDVTLNVRSLIELLQEGNRV